MPENEHLSDGALLELLSEKPTTDVDFSHLERCSTCQKKMESLAADDWWWNEGRQLYSSAAVLIKTQDAESKSPKMFDPVAAEVEAVVEHFDAAIHPELFGQVDEFQVESLIGVGGMGVVFKGFDRELNRPVAIKFLSPKLARSGLARQRFAREAKSAAAVCHDNIIPIFRINTNWVYPYFVMPYISGNSLEQLVQRDGALEAGQLVQIATQIASGLSAAHEQGLIHRDIKPGNILLENSFNRIVITDFGLVHDENDVRLTQTGVVAGTPQFMSPEQTEGKHLDARTDLFSLGAVMYWMATGRAPFQGKSQFEMLREIRDVEPSKVRSANSAVPEKLEAIIEMLLQKNSSKRIGSAKELESLLRKYSAHLQNPLENRAPKVGRSIYSRIILLGSALLIALCCLAACFQLPLNRNAASSLEPMQEESNAHSSTGKHSSFDVIEPDDDSAHQSQPESEVEAEPTEALVQSKQVLGIDEETARRIRIASEAWKKAHSKTKAIGGAMNKGYSPTKPVGGALKGRYFQTMPMDRVLRNQREKDRAELKEFRRLFSLVDRGADRVATIESQPLHLLAFLNETNPKFVSRVIALWESETQRKYGSKDLYVTEPILISTQLEIKKGNWVAAEFGFRRIESILKNNFASAELQKQFADYADICKTQTDDSQSEELLGKTVDELYPAIGKQFSRRLRRIRMKEGLIRSHKN